MENVSSSCLALVALCCADKRLFSVVALLPSFLFFLDTLWCHILCVCSQRCRFMCDGLHDISCMAQVKKSDHTELCACAAHFLNFFLFFIFIFSCFTCFFFVAFLFMFVPDHPHCHSTALVVFSHSRTLSHDVLHSLLVSSKRSYLACRTQSRCTANMVAERC